MMAVGEGARAMTFQVVGVTTPSRQQARSHAQGIGPCPTTTTMTTTTMLIVKTTMLPSGAEWPPRVRADTRALGELDFTRQEEH